MLKLTLPHRPSHHVTAVPNVVIVGGGFTGASIARLLSLRSPSRGANGLGNITVFEPRAVLGCGLAYDTDDPELRLHVAAHRMRATPGNPGAFLNWLKLSGRLDADPKANNGGAIYARRGDFGQFMQAQMAPHLESKRIQHIQNRVLSVERLNGNWLVWDESGISHKADIVVIATSNPPPATPFEIISDASDEHGEVKPQDIPTGDSVAIAGAGLTAIDLLLSLKAQGHYGPITLVSRSGLLPRQQPEGDFMPHGEAMFDKHRSATALLRSVRLATTRVTADGLPWQSVMDALRHEVPGLWANLPFVERKRVRRHLLRWYEVHRQRMTPAMAKDVEEMQCTGQLTVAAGRIKTVERRVQEIELTIGAKGPASSKQIKAQHLLIATGPDYAHIFQYHRYLRQLQEAGFITPDKYGFGLACDRHSRAVARDGHPVPHLYIAGPLARATFGELTAVPEIAAQADQISRSILASSNRRSRTVFIRSLRAATVGSTPFTTERNT